MRFRITRNTDKPGWTLTEVGKLVSDLPGTLHTPAIAGDPVSYSGNFLVFGKVEFTEDGVFTSGNVFQDGITNALVVTNDEEYGE